MTNPNEKIEVTIGGLRANDRRPVLLAGREIGEIVSSAGPATLGRAWVAAETLMPEYARIPGTQPEVADIILRTDSGATPVVLGLSYRWPALRDAILARADAQARDCDHA